MLLVLKEAEPKKLPSRANPVRSWLVKCDCSKEFVVTDTTLRHSKIMSCGCTRLDGTPRHQAKHGLLGTREYTAWQNMLRRCENPSHPSYPNYGGRGIKVCERWHDVVNFYEDMGQVEEGLSLERINVNGNYEPSNCKWETMLEQRANTTTALRVMVDGKLMSSAKAAEYFGLRDDQWIRWSDAAKFTPQQMVEAQYLL